ncbi:hypothetical protein [Gayadomonas joobiniege]|uniref:hypothetical protein n=1 Tax=Gayadomonas joobiniege TaxID=1234606 RepID=UPI00036CB288|nr:hypothetical protein [Gayadomonas joobiniege]
MNHSKGSSRQKSILAAVVFSSLSMVAASVQAATVNISSYSGADGVLSWGEFNNAQNAAGTYGTINFDQTLTTSANLVINTKGLTILGIDDASGMRTFTKTHANYTTTAPTDWNDMNPVTDSTKIDPSAPNSSIFRVNVDDVSFKNIHLTASHWPLLKNNVSSVDGEGTRVATGVEMGISVGAGKNLTVDDVKVDKVNVVINYDRDKLPHGLTLTNSTLTGGRGIINSAESSSAYPSDTALDSKMLIANNHIVAYQWKAKNFCSARGFTFDYGNYAHTADPSNGPGPIDFLDSEVLNNNFDALSTFNVGFNRVKNVFIGKVGQGNSFKGGRYRKNYINMIHFEAGSSDINIIDNDINIYKVDGEIVTDSSHISASFGHKTQGAIKTVLAKQNKYMGFPSNQLVGNNIQDWRFQDEEVALGAGVNLPVYVRTVGISQADANHKLWGTEANNDFWTTGDKWAKFYYGWGQP